MDHRCAVRRFFFTEIITAGLLLQPFLLIPPTLRLLVSSANPKIKPGMFKSNSDKFNPNLNYIRRPAARANAIEDKFAVT